MNSPAADPQLVSVRTPPNSIEAEQSVLGGLLLDNSAWDRVADLVGAGDFYRQSVLGGLLLDNSAWDRVADMVGVGDFYRHDHRLIFQAIAKLIDHSRPADVVTVYESTSRCRAPARPMRPAGWLT